MDDDFTAGREHTNPVEKRAQGSAIRDDTLAQCVVAFMARDGDPKPLDTLIAGLPLEKGRLTPALAVRALHRGGYAAKLARRSLDDIGDILLPAILLTRDGGAVILIARRSADCTIHDPQIGAAVEIATAKLLDAYSGKVILARRADRAAGGAVPAVHGHDEHWFWGAIVRLWPTYAYVALAAAFINVLAIASPLFTMNVYDRVLPNKAIPTLWVLAAGMAIALLFDLALRALRSWLIDSAGRRADVLLASRIYAHVMAIQLHARPATTGSFASHLKEFEQVREFFTSSTIATFTDMLFFFVFLFVIVQIGGPIAYVPAIAAVVIAVIALIFQLPLNRAASANAAETAQRHSLLVETIASLETVKAIRAESHLQKLWEGFVGASSRTVERVRSLTARLNHLTMTIQQLVSVAVVVIGAYLFQSGAISTGAIIACVMLASRSVAPLGQFALVAARSQQSLTSLRHLNKVMEIPSERPAGRNFLSQPIGDCHIQFQNVTFSYPGTTVPALNGLNLAIRPGERVGIIGKIGSGKTTLGRLLIKLYEPQDGAILIDGIDMRQFHPHEVRRAIGLLGQDADLFHGTVRSNILLGSPEATDADLVEAARLAGVDDFVRRHPAGFDMPVGERGQALSGGQKQSVALARTLIGRPKVIFLDEPSSAMDLASERQLIEHLRGILQQGQTVIVSTHRYSMLDLVDRLVVLANGRVVADGPKDQVLEALRQQTQGSPRSQGSR
jgi:ATP-binding cassette subfamily C protein LapB